MIPISLPSGKTYYARDIEEALDIDYQELMANDVGLHINDPFYGSTLDGPRLVEEEIIIIKELPDLEEVEEIPLDINPED